MNGKTLEILVDGQVAIALTEELVDGQMHIGVSGEIKNEVALEFEDELMAAFTVCQVVQLDLSKVTYIASIAMRALLAVQQIVDENEGADLVISKISKEVREMFETSGFLDILHIIEE